MTHAIERLIEKIAVQTAVYWPSPADDGYGRLTFGTAVEISVRWSDVSELIRTAKGEEYTCKAKVIVTQDLDNGGYLYLGELDDLSVAKKANPQLEDNAHRIVKFNKIPMIFQTDVFTRVAYL
jgi:hypothetical protein